MSAKNCTTHHHACDCREAMFAEMLEAVIQYRDDLKRPPTGDSIERRLAMVNAAIAKATGAAS